METILVFCYSIFVLCYGVCDLIGRYTSESPLELPTSVAPQERNNSRAIYSIAPNAERSCCAQCNFSKKCGP